MKQSLSFVTLGVSDLARSRRFYQALGWRESASSQEAIAFYQVGNLVFALFDRASLAEDAGIAAAGNGFSGVTLAHNVASQQAVDATLQEAVAAGATLVLPGTPAHWGGFRGYFADPDGFLWEVCFNPFITLEADGGVRLPD